MRPNAIKDANAIKYFGHHEQQLTLASNSPPTLRNAIYCFTPSIRFWNSTLATFIFDIIEPKNRSRFVRDFEKYIFKQLKQTYVSDDGSKD